VFELERRESKKSSRKVIFPLLLWMLEMRFFALSPSLFNVARRDLIYHFFFPGRSAIFFFFFCYFQTSIILV